MATTAIVVVTTVPTKADALKLANRLVDKRVAACVQLLGPIRSVYRWEGRLEESQEWQIHIKTLSANYNDVESFLLTQHPYDVPEILTFTCDGGSDDYLAWMASSVTHPGKPH